MNSKVVCPIFIIGFGRSGTKLLRSILNNHTLINIPDIETNFLPLWAAKWDSYGDLSKRENFHSFYKEVIQYPYFYYMKKKEQLIDEDEWYRRSGDYSLSQIYEALILFHINDSTNGDLIWGDKSPSYISHMDLLKELFPQAKFIHIVRDVRDSCISSHKAWGTSRLRMVQRWTDSLPKPRLAAKNFPMDYIEVFYENLITNPEKELTNIFSFMGLDYEPEVLLSINTGEKKGDAKNLNKIKKDNKHKYKMELSEKQIRKIESIAGNVLKQYGYSINYQGVQKPLSSVSLWVFRIYDGFQHIYRRVRGQGVKSTLNFVWKFFKQNRASENLTK